MKKFLIFELNSICYSSYIYFAESVAAELKKAGYEVEIFRGTEKNIDDLEQYCKKTYTACLEFNSYLPKAVLDDGTFLLDQIEAPFYNFILDHPLYHHDVLRRKLRNFHVFCLDENHKNYIEKYYPHIKSVHVLPMTGEHYFSTEPFKSIDLLFTGTYTDPKEIQDIIDMEPAFLKKDITFLIEQMLTHTEMTQEAALQILMKNSDIITQDNFHIFMNSYFLADTFVRALIREKVLRILIDANIPITICGSGWEKFISEKKELLTIKSSIPYKDTFQLMSQSKIVLNIMPWFKSGSHDRIFSSMLNKCVSLTDSSTYLKDTFKNGETLLFYDLNHLEELPKLIKDLLNDPIKMKLISEAGFTEAAKNHTWEKRVKKMLEEMQDQ